MSVHAHDHAHKPCMLSHTNLECFLMKWISNQFAISSKACGPIVGTSNPTNNFLGLVDRIVDCLTWLGIGNDHVWSTWTLSFQTLKVEWKWKSCQCEGSRSLLLLCMPFPLCLTSKLKRWSYVVHNPWGSRTSILHIAQHLSFYLTMRLGRDCSFKQSLHFLLFLS
jgi:hypothetical protein